MCSCHPQNPSHVKQFIIDEDMDDGAIYHDFNSRFRMTYVMVDHMKKLLKHGEYIDDTIISAILSRIQLAIKHPIYFLEAGFLGYWMLNTDDKKITKYANKVDKQMMKNADSIIIPVNYHGCHWQLLEVNFPKSCFILHDGKR